MTKLSDPEQLQFRRSKACHEAGHDVVAVALGVGVESVSLHPDKTRGAFEWYSSARTHLKEGESQYEDEDVTIFLADAAAQTNHAPSSMRGYSAIGDYQKARSLVFFRCIVPESEFPPKTVTTRAMPIHPRIDFH